jgi:hypothetical protein
MLSSLRFEQIDSSISEGAQGTTVNGRVFPVVDVNTASEINIFDERALTQELLGQKYHFNKYSLKFANSESEGRFHSYSLRLQSTGFVIFTTVLPVLFYVYQLSARLEQVINASPNDGRRKYLYALIALNMVTGLFALAYVVALKRWERNYKSLSYEVHTAEFDASLRDYINRSNFVVTIGAVFSIFATLFLALYFVAIVACGECYSGCLENFPIFTGFGIVYLPLHFSVFVGHQWIVTVVNFIVSVSSFGVAYHLRFDITNYGGFGGVVHASVLFALWFVILYCVQYMKMRGFRDRELLVALVSEGERETFNSLLSIFQDI